MGRIDELLPCPFCDWPARFVHRDGMYWCECRNGNCGAVQPVCNHADVAIRTWNRRAQPSPDGGQPQPDWTQAPEWAQWWTVDPDGSVYWYEQKPILATTVDYCGWQPKTIEGYQQGYMVPDGEVDIPLGIDWRTLKFRRPQEVQP